MREKLGGKPDLYQDYRKLLDRKDIDVVTNGTPDHWHTPINVAACRAGKDVYTEKPLGLTIAEGKLLRKVVEETGRMVQVGTQLRSDSQFQHYRTAIEIVRNGRIGYCGRSSFRCRSIRPKAAHSRPDRRRLARLGPLPGTSARPPVLSAAAGQHIPLVVRVCRRDDHRLGRAHDIDIAHWGMDMEHSGPLTVEAVGNHPNGGREDCYNNPDVFKAELTYPGGLKMTVESRQGARELPSPATGDISSLIGVRPTASRSNSSRRTRCRRTVGRSLRRRATWETSLSREDPRDAPRAVEIAHRVATVCHLVNIAIRVKRKLAWDAKTEQIVGDDEANALQGRPQRKGYSIT